MQNRMFDSITVGSQASVWDCPYLPVFQSVFWDGNVLPVSDLLHHDAPPTHQFLIPAERASARGALSLLLSAHRSMVLISLTTSSQVPGQEVIVSVT